jgi:hypothetical protein
VRFAITKTLYHPNPSTIFQPTLAKVEMRGIYTVEAAGILNSIVIYNETCQWMRNTNLSTMYGAEDVIRLDH